MKNIVFLATAWGPRYGGINSFNQDLAVATAETLAGKGRVFCAVLTATEEEVSAAKRKGVELFSIERNEEDASYDESYVHDIHLKFKKQYKDEHIDWWVGHDVVSGSTALHGRNVVSGSRACLIMHMSYADYQPLHNSSQVQAHEKERTQRVLFKGADVCFANGPLLRDALANLLGKAGTSRMLIPGFPNVEDTSSVDGIQAITIGRLDKRADSMKLSSLAIDAFGCAIKHANSIDSQAILLTKNPKIRALGINTNDSTQIDHLKKMLEDRAERKVVFSLLPFTENREMLLEELSIANLAFMLSWHEGFGLVGWEAIASETPLIISQKSGLWQLLVETLTEEHAKILVKSINIRGSSDLKVPYLDKDVEDVKAAVLTISSNIKKWKENAKVLKGALEKKLDVSWIVAASKLVDAFDELDCIDNYKILIVEDDHELREGMREYLEDSDYNSIYEAKNGIEAIELAAQINPELILLDLDLPDITGADVIANLRNLGINTRVIIVSGENIDLVYKLYTQLGVYSFVPKHHFFYIGIETISAALRYGSRLLEAQPDSLRLIETQLKILSTYSLSPNNNKPKMQNNIKQTIEQLYEDFANKDYELMRETIDAKMNSFDDAIMNDSSKLLSSFLLLVQTPAKV